MARIRGLRPSPARASDTAAPFVPADPAALGIALDPGLAELRGGLAAHRRRLWLRRAVRRAWYVLASVAVIELALVVAQRLWPLEQAPLLAAAVPVLGMLVLLVLVVRARPSLGETALAVDAEGGAGDAIASALAFASSAPGTAGIAAADVDDTIEVGAGFDLHAAEDRFIRRQRRDAVARLRAVDPGLFRPRLARRPALVALAALALVVPAALLPNPQDAVIAQNRAVREEAERQAERIDDIAEDLEGRGEDANDPRSRLAEELRELAERLRTNPGDLDLNLAQLGAVEDDVRAQLDPANEQRGASLAALSRSLSRAATGDPQANAGGDPEETQRDLDELGEELDSMTQAEREALARALAELQGAASQADAAAGAALRDAASSLAQGDTEGARAALDRLGQALDAAADRIQVNRDLATAASNLQDARRNLANAGGQQGQGGQQGNGQQGNGQQGNGQQGNGQQGQPGQSPGSSPGAGQGAGQSPGASPGSGQGQGQGQGGGSLGGGGSNANHLGSGSSSGLPGGPVNPNRPSELGEDLGSVFAPFDRIGKPGDPSYVAGTGGDGQTQQGNQQGQGSNNGSYVPYADVFADFYGYAQTTLDRSYVPISVKDYVRDYFSSLDPRQ